MACRKPQASGAWDAEKVEILRQLLPVLRDGERVDALAAELGTTRSALLTKAKRLGIRHPRPSSRPWSDDEDAVLRACMREAPSQARGLQQAAAKLGRSVGVVAQRWERLQRRRRARVGDWSEAELAQGISWTAQHGVDHAARRLARPRDDLQLKLLALGCAGLADEDHLLSLAEAAVKLGCEPEELLAAVRAGELSARPQPKGSVLPTPQWTTSELRLAAYLVAFPDRLDLQAADPAFVLRIAFQAGRRAGRQMLSSAD